MKSVLIRRRTARLLGLGAILGVLGLQAAGSFGCYRNSLVEFFEVAKMLLVGPLLPALVALATPNPLCAVGACLFFAPWLPYAFYTDCVRADFSGGASMVYFGVLVGGTMTSLLGAVLTIPATKALRIRVVPTETEDTDDPW